MRILHRCLQPAPFRVSALRCAFVHDGGLVVEIEHRSSVDGEYAVEHHVACVVIETGLHAETVSALAGLSLQLRVNDELCVAIVLIKDGTDTDISDAYLWRGEQGDATVDTSQAPHVLIFQIRTIAIFENLQCELIAV